MKCLACGGDLVEKNDDYLWDAFYLKSPTLVPNLYRLECTSCDEMIINGASIQYAQPFLDKNYTDEYREKLNNRKKDGQ